MNDSGQQYELAFEERAGYLYAHVLANKITQEIALAYLKEVMKRCRIINCTRLLIERNIPEMLPDGTLFFVAAEFQQMIAGVRVAFVNKFSANEDALDFAVRVGLNRGADYGVFDNNADAEKWLLSD